MEQGNGLFTLGQGGHMKIPAWVKAELTTRLAIHTAQAIGGAITATAVDVPALTQGQLTVDSASQLLAGVVIQTAMVALSQFVSKLRARRAAKKAKQP